MKRLLILIGFLILAVSLLATPKQAEATFHGNVWVKQSETPCNPNCGETEATHEVTYVCVDGEGNGRDECSIKSEFVCDTYFPHTKICWHGHTVKTPETKTVTEKCETEAAIACEPEVTPEPTPRPEVPTTPAGAPELAQCPGVEEWMPQVTYNGFTHNKDGSYTFTYTVKAIETENPTFLIWYGPTPETVHTYPLIVHGANKTATVIITQEQSTNWIKVWHYVEPGCVGKNPSNPVN